VGPLIARYCQASSRCQRWAELELIDRERRMVERRIKEARFPAVKSPGRRPSDYFLIRSTPADNGIGAQASNYAGPSTILLAVIETVRVHSMGRALKEISAKGAPEGEG
jgi:hypothetical protein